jgi:hypothetical protein
MADLLIGVHVQKDVKAEPKQELVQTPPLLELVHNAQELPHKIVILKFVKVKH